MDKFSKKKRSEIMSLVKGKNTKPELLVRKICFGLGFRYRLHGSNLPGKPDLVFTKHKKVIFVHGCFWHGHTCRSGQNRPSQNSLYWKQKLDKNILRDKKNQKSLKSSSWRYLIVWQCEMKIKDRERLIKKISSFLRK